MNPEKRLILPLAQRGNIGKSTFVALVAQWLDHHSVNWLGFDADPDHQSFSRLFPEVVQPVPIGDEPEGDLIAVLRRSCEETVMLIDPRAHLASSLVRTLEMLRFPETFGELGGRISVALFPSDDLEVMTDLDLTVERLGDSVDYVVVKNRARASRTRMYDGSEIETELNRLGAVELELPVLLSVARNHIAVLETRLQRGITHAEVIANKELSVDPLVRLATQDWLRGLFRRLDVLAARLLPLSLAVKIVAQREVGRSAAARGRRINTMRL